VGVFEQCPVGQRETRPCSFNTTGTEDHQGTYIGLELRRLQDIAKTLDLAKTSGLAKTSDLTYQRILRTVAFVHHFTFL